MHDPAGLTLGKAAEGVRRALEKDVNAPFVVLLDRKRMGEATRALTVKADPYHAALIEDRVPPHLRQRPIEEVDLEALAPFLCMRFCNVLHRLLILVTSPG